MSKAQSSLSEGSADDHQIDQGLPCLKEDNGIVLSSITLSLCASKTSVCKSAQHSPIQYSNKPLGLFLQHHLFDQGYRCSSCGMPSEAHTHCYAHKQGTLTISIKNQRGDNGEKQGKIWMWHQCQRCVSTNDFPQKVVMSDADWGLSFGKYLGLYFSDDTDARKNASCGHSLYRDCLWFYGLGTTIACFQYGPANVYSICLPPYKLEFNYDKQEWIQKEVDEVSSSAEILFSKVVEILHQISRKHSKEPTELGLKVSELEVVLHKEKEEFKESLQIMVQKDAIDILEINKLRRQLVFQSVLWDQRLRNISESDVSNISPLRDLVHQSGVRLLLSVGSGDTGVPILDNEPTSIISYALASPEYQKFAQPLDLENFPSLESSTEQASSSESILFNLESDNFLKALHTRVSFSDDGMKYSVTCYHAMRFEALRESCCPSQLDFIRSISRCKKLDGMSNSFFAKTLDDRFIIKQVTKTELESFTKFVSDYFEYLFQSFCFGSSTCLAKILGIYQVTIKDVTKRKESSMDVIVMENVFFKHNVKKIYDLKGSSQSRYNPNSSGVKKVLLDQNLIEGMATSPILLGSNAKRSLERAVWSDTSFLSSVNTMDYSLVVGMDEEKHELVVGIINYTRQYTWDKHIETWVNAIAMPMLGVGVGGPKNASPTVISPTQYKKRFRKAVSTYFQVVAVAEPEPEQHQSDPYISQEEASMD